MQRYQVEYNDHLGTYSVWLYDCVGARPILEDISPRRDAAQAIADALQSAFADGMYSVSSALFPDELSRVA